MKNFAKSISLEELKVIGSENTFSNIEYKNSSEKNAFASNTRKSTSLISSELPLNHSIRYSRQIIVPNIGIEGQLKMIYKRICIIGMGGLGSPVLMYLCNTGIENIGIVDYDVVEISNLQRQVIHSMEGINKKGDFFVPSLSWSKVKSAAEFVKKINPTIKINVFDQKVNSGNISKILGDYDLVIDCCDNIKLRYLINDYCVINNKALVSASVLKWEGQIHVYSPLENAFNQLDGNKLATVDEVCAQGMKPFTPCYRCLFPNPKTIATSCDQSGVVGPMCGVIGSMQANEVMKIILNEDKQATTHPVSGISKFIIFNGYKNTYREITNQSKPCQVCLSKKYILEDEVINCCSAETPEGDKSCIVVHSINWDVVLFNSSKYKIIDIRTSVHFRMISMKGSINIPLDLWEMNANEIIEKLDISLPILIYCYRGKSSKMVVELLRARNIEAFSINGGVEEFKRLTLGNL